MSSRSLQRRSRAELGVGIGAWLQRARLLQSLELLADPNLQVGEVALRCGYRSQVAFTRAFRRQLGATPSAWRSQRGPP